MRGVTSKIFFYRSLEILEKLPRLSFRIKQKKGIKIIFFTQIYIRNDKPFLRFYATHNTLITDYLMYKCFMIHLYKNKYVQKIP